MARAQSLLALWVMHLWTPSPLDTEDMGNLVVDDIGGDQTGTLRVIPVVHSNLGVDIQGAWDTRA